jgi:hypothetical protein
VNTLRYFVTLRDAKGWTGRTGVWISYDPADPGNFEDVATCAATLRNAVEGLSNAAFQSDGGASGDNSALPVAYGASGVVYQNAWQQAQMEFQDSSGGIHRYRIPAPLVAIFDTDRLTVLNDGTQAAVVAYVAAMKTASGTAFVSSRSGQALTKFIGGILVEGRQPRRFNAFIKSSHLVAGEGE